MGVSQDQNICQEQDVLDFLRNNSVSAVKGYSFCENVEVKAHQNLR